jgi:hypothetical protein
MGVQQKLQKNLLQCQQWRQQCLRHFDTNIIGSRREMAKLSLLQHAQEIQHAQTQPNTHA